MKTNRKEFIKNSLLAGTAISLNACNWVEAEQKSGAKSSIKPVVISTWRFGMEANAAATELLGFTREEMIGRTSLELGLWPDPADRAEIVRELSLNGSVRNFVTRNRKKSGTM